MKQSNETNWHRFERFAWEVQCGAWYFCIFNTKITAYHPSDSRILFNVADFMFYIIASCRAAAWDKRAGIWHYSNAVDSLRSARALNATSQNFCTINYFAGVSVCNAKCLKTECNVGANRVFDTRESILSSAFASHHKNYEHLLTNGFRGL